MSGSTTLSKAATSFHEGGKPIKSVAVFSTGTGEIHPEHFYGTRKPALWWALTSKQWMPVPINLFAIEHADGLVLFDTGQDRAAVTDPQYLPKGFTGFILRRLFKFHMGPDDTLSRQLEKAGYSAADVRKAVFSHLHFDHVGGLREILQADLIVSREEWGILSQPHPEREGIFRRDIELPEARWQRITFEPTNDPSVAPFTQAYDVMGDGSMVLLPTPGHTPGSLSMLVRQGKAPPLLLVGDLCYGLDLLMRDQFPGTGDKKALRASYAKVRALKETMPDLVILPSHDPQTAERLHQTPGWHDVAVTARLA